MNAERVPFKFYCDHADIAGERFKVSVGGRITRNVLMARSIKLFDAFCAVHAEPPKVNPYDSQELMDDRKVHDLYPQSHIGPSFFCSPQYELVENHAHYGTGYIRDYVHELMEVHTYQAVEDRDHLEHWFREDLPKKKADKVPKGDLLDLTDVWLRTKFFNNLPKQIDDERRKMYDVARNNVKYFKKQLRGNPKTEWIADHFDEHLHIKTICEYAGDIDWQFV